jgi:hypothetical protein
MQVKIFKMDAIKTGENKRKLLTFDGVQSLKVQTKYTQMCFRKKIYSYNTSTFSTFVGRS